MQGEGEAIGVAGLGHEAFGSHRVIAFGADLGIKAQSALGHQLAGGHGKPFHQLAGDALAVDGHAERAPHSHIAQRVGNGPAGQIGHMR